MEASGTNTFCSDSAAWGRRGDGGGVPWGARALVGARGQDASTTPVWCLGGGACTRRDHLGCFLKYTFQLPAPPPGLSPRRWSQVPDLDLGSSPSHSPGPGPESVGPFLRGGGLAFLCLLQGAWGRCSMGEAGVGAAELWSPHPSPDCQLGSQALPLGRGLQAWGVGSGRHGCVDWAALLTFRGAASCPHGCPSGCLPRTRHRGPGCKPDHSQFGTGMLYRCVSRSLQETALSRKRLLLSL